ncbi:MAG TPA: hypothetical protein VG320_05395 [Paraburkholderia sp.]|jgi:hypothetical protein|uniref:hypothetical protein n=1 Tax=Paraburkholderia sp. TaxID=1926495 RepID=UPI002DE9FA11|nr:hypothetical protein [Paraburkholderia sp.]
MVGIRLINGRRMAMQAGRQGGPVERAALVAARAATGEGGAAPEGCRAKRRRAHAKRS